MFSKRTTLSRLRETITVVSASERKQFVLGAFREPEACTIVPPRDAGRRVPGGRLRFSSGFRLEERLQVSRSDPSAGLQWRAWRVSASESRCGLLGWIGNPNDLADDLAALHY